MKRKVIHRLGVAFFTCAGLLAVAACIPIDAEFTVTPRGGPPPLTVTFDATGSRHEAVAFEWDFGDGTSGTGMIVDHTYTQLGTYEVRLTTHPDPASSSLVGKELETVFVTNGPNPTFLASASPANPLTIAFDGSLSTPPAEARYGPFVLIDINYGEMPEHYVASRVTWDFGDGTTSAWSNNLSHGLFQESEAPEVFTPNHTYAIPGIYTVSLTIMDVLFETETFEQVISVGGAAPEPDGDEEPEPEPDLLSGFSVTGIFWQVTDEEDDPEGECLDIWGSILNGNDVPAGCELTATAFDAQDNPVGSTAHWPTGDTNMAAHQGGPYAFLHCALTVAADQVARVEVTVTDARAW